MPPGLIRIYQYLIFSILAAPDTAVAVNSEDLEPRLFPCEMFLVPGMEYRE
jgi:hypothetical protein